MESSVTSPARPPRRTTGRRPGQLTPGWRIVTGVTWTLAFVAFTGVWKASRELGLSTWWLGPVGEPQPIVVVLLPFVAPAAMVLATFNNVRSLPWFGLLASAVTAAIGAADLDRVLRLGIVELSIAGAGAAVSTASFSGMLRSVSENRPDPVDHGGQNGQ